jgi:hypothetical protein
MTPALSPTPEQLARVQKMVETAPHWARTPQHHADIDALRACLAAVARLRAVEQFCDTTLDAGDHHGFYLAALHDVLALLRAGTPEGT